MSHDTPSLPASIKYSSDSFNDLRDAAKVGAKGLGALTPYFNLDGIKHFNVSVNGYDNEKILDLDTAKLFLGTLLDPGSGTSDGTYPYAGEEGEMGGPTLAWPLRFQRVHFYASQGRPEDPLSDVSEYYTYFLCGQPVRVNGITESDSDISSSDEDEEANGVQKSWNSSFDSEGVYDQRMIIGNLGKTGEVVTDVRLTSGDCFVDLVVTKGIAFLLRTGGSSETYRVGYTPNTISSAMQTLCNSISDIGDAFDSMNQCMSETPSSGCTPENVCEYIGNIVDCLTGLSIDINCDSILYCP